MKHRSLVTPFIAVLLIVPMAMSAQRDATRPGTGATDVPGRVWRVWPDSAWRQIGPASFGGRVDDIEAVPNDPRVIFVGAASGGVFRSRNNGVTWDAVFDAFGATLSIGDIAIAPSDPNIVWVGTGEANNRQSSTWGDGVYRSLDGGTTWQNMGLRATQSIGRIVIDRHDPNVVFVAAVGHLFGPNEERGLYRTRDGGKTWKKVLHVDDNTGVIDVAMMPDGRTLLAASYERRRRAFGFAGSGPGSGLWRSVDAGDTWQRVTSGLPGGIMGRIGFDIAKSDPSIVFAVVENRNGGVFRSTDAGLTWTRRNTLNDRPTYYGQIRVDPLNPDRVWLLGTLLHQSTDGGKTFTKDSVARIHPDHHALWIDPVHPDHMLLGNDGGVFATYDGARNWDYINNLPLGQFYDIAVDVREPYWVYGGVQDNGTFMFPSGTYSRGALGDDDVTFIGYGDGFQAATDPTNPRLVYTNSQNGRGYLVDLVTRQERRMTPVSADRSSRYRFNWNTATLLSPNDPHTYYYGANKLLKTSDYGTTWQEVSPDLTKHLEWRKLSLGTGAPVRDSTTLSRDDGVSEYGNITTISESPRTAGWLLVGTDDGNVQMSTDAGAHWTDLTSRFPLPGSRAVSDVLASRHDTQVAYVTFDGHADDDMQPYIFRTEDGGATWKRIGDLPAGIVVKTITEDPVNPKLLFAGTEFGLYWSRDGGRHWTFPGGTLPRVMVDRILVNERTHDLVLGTYGRGVVILDDIQALERATPADAGASRLFPIREATIVYQWRDLPVPGDRKFAAPNVPLGALITYSLPEDHRSPAAASRSRPDSATNVRLRITNADGRLVRELDVPGGAGMHRVTWDLRGQLAFVPPPADSGYYGAPRAPLVAAGTYSVTLSTGTGSQVQLVSVRDDPRAMRTPEAGRARAATIARIDSVVQAFAVARRNFTAADSEFTRLAASVRRRSTIPPATDSLLKAMQTEANQLRGRFAGSYGTPIGQIFDLLGGLESTSNAPTEAEERTLRFAASDIADAIKRLRDFTDLHLVRLRGANAAPLVGSAPAPVPH